jgi:hypothetical protein
LLEGLLALWIVEIWDTRPSLKPAVAAIAILFVGMNVLHTIGIWRKDRLHAEYAEAIAFLKQTTTPVQLTVGSSELAFGLGFDANLVDDHRLGYFSHKQPDVIVVNERYRELFERMKVYKPEVSVYVEDLLRRHFTKRYDRNNWQIYFRTS